MVAGATGAGLSSGVIIVLGLANLLADGFSMAVSNLLGSRAELQQQDVARRREIDQLRRFPTGEREEVRQIFAAKGFAGEMLERAVEIITSDEKLWVETMMREELGFSKDGRRPSRAASATFAAFVLVGFLPLAPFVYGLITSVEASAAFVWSAAATAGAFFIVGAAKSRFVDERWWAAGAQTLLMGGAAATLAYLVGRLLESLVS